MAYKRQWLRPSKLHDYVVGWAPSIRTVKDAEYQLYWAVIEGRVRARHKGKNLDADMLERLRARKWSDDPNDLYGLPPDIELSVEDAEEIWGNEDVGLDPADRIAIYGISQAGAVLSMETALLNLSVLLNRLNTRLRALDESAMKFKPVFEERWTKHHHEAKTYLAHMTDSERRENFSNQLAVIEARREDFLSTLDEAHTRATADIGSPTTAASGHEASDKVVERIQPKRRGGNKPGPYRRRLGQYLKFRDEKEPGVLDNLPIGQLVNDARRRLEYDGVQGVPTSRSAMTEAIRSEMCKLRARETPRR